MRRRGFRISRVPAWDLSTAPRVQSISPTSGSLLGGDTVTITVQSSAGCTSATVGGITLTSFVIVDGTHVRGVTSAHSAGAVDVTVTNPTGTGTLAAAFTYAASLPTALSGLKLWLRADLGCTAGSWLDQSGLGDSGRNAAQASAPLQPTINATDASYNNQSTLSFAAASGQYMLTGTWSTALAQPCSVFVVGNNDGTATTEFYFDGIDGANRLVLDKSNATVYEVFAGASAGGGIDGVNNPAAHGFTMASPSVVLSEFNGASSSAYVNSEIPLGSRGAPSPYYPAIVANAGAGQALGLTIGAAVNTTLPLNGKLREVIVYNRILTITERRQVLAYIASNSGITVADTFVVYDGNSNMYGAGTTIPGGTTAIPAVTDPYAAKRMAGWFNCGASGQTTPQRTADMATTFSLCDSRVTHKTLVLLEVQNDCSQNGGNANPADTSYAATAWANLIAYSVAARAAGFTRLVLCTCLPEGSAGAQQANYEALRQAVNTLIRANYAAYFDAIADIGGPSSPIGTVASTTTAYYAAIDTVHLTDTGSTQAAVIIGPKVFP